MQKGYTFPFCPDPGLGVYKLNAGCRAAFQRRVEIGDGNANVMYSGAFFRHVLPDRRVTGGGFEKFNERFAALHGCDPRPVRIRQLHLRHFEHVTEEREDAGNGLHRDSNVGNSGHFC